MINMHCVTILSYSKPLHPPTPDPDGNLTHTFTLTLMGT